MIVRFLKLLSPILFFYAFPILGQDFDKLSLTDLIKMPLGEVLNVEINTGSLKPSTIKTSTSPITVITSEQIQISQARNIATLLEIYVPGMIVMTHQEGDKIGIRGLIAAENYKILLLLNGKNITNSVYEGAALELDQWDMSDIERIEVMRGPGSVTYGSGAIAGVINIITKNVKSEDNAFVSAGVAYNPIFRSTGGNVQLSKKFGKIGVFSYTNFRKSLGQENPDYYIPDPKGINDTRYMGKNVNDKTGPQSYLADGLRPQVKTHIDLSFGDNFSVWTRYTQSGQTHYFVKKELFPNAKGDTVLVDNTRFVALRSFAVAPEYKYQFSEKLKLVADITYDNQEYVRGSVGSIKYPRDHYNNIRDYAFSQERVIANVLLNFETKKYSGIIGYQFNRTAIKAPWGKSPDYIWINEGVNIISDTNSSVYYTDKNSQMPKNGKVEQVGDGIFVYTHSLMLETTYSFTRYLKLLFASRLDFPSISTPLYSPRLSLISEINSRNIIKLSAQRALRMMPLRAQYLYHKNSSLDNTKNDFEHETLNSLELSYLFVPKKEIVIEFHSFYNDINAIGYTGNDLQFLGNLQLGGFDLEASINWGNNSFIVNHAYIHLIKMNMNTDLKTGNNRNNISYSDYYYNTNGGLGGDYPLLLQSTGKGLNNISNNATKFIFTKKMLNKRLIFHANSRIFWDYKGTYDEMEMYSKAYNNYDVSTLNESERAVFNQQKAEFEKEKELLDKSGAYKLEFKINMSISYKWELSEKINLFTSLYFDNLIGTKKRYYVSTGSRNYYPERLRFIEEPRTVGIKLQLNFM